MKYTNYALVGLRRPKCQRAMMKIQVNHMLWEVKDGCTNVSRIISNLSLCLDC